MSLEYTENITINLQLFKDKKVIPNRIFFVYFELIHKPANYFFMPSNDYKPFTID